jgi:hypothetical protein
VPPLDTNFDIQVGKVEVPFRHEEEMFVVYIDLEGKKHKHKYAYDEVHHETEGYI